MPGPYGSFHALWQAVKTEPLDFVPSLPELAAEFGATRREQATALAEIRSGFTGPGKSRERAYRNARRTAERQLARGEVTSRGGLNRRMYAHAYRIAHGIEIKGTVWVAISGEIDRGAYRPRHFGTDIMAPPVHIPGDLLDDRGRTNQEVIEDLIDAWAGGYFEDALAGGVAYAVDEDHVELWFDDL